MARTADKPASDKPLSRRVLVEVTRDLTAKTSKVVFQHEIPLLELIHGEGNVKTLDPSTLDDGYNPKPSPAILPFNKTQDVVPRPSDSVGIGFVFAGSAEAEYQRLQDVYGKMHEENISCVEKIYGRFQDGRFERVVGGAQLADLPDQQLRALLESWGLAPIPPRADMTDAQKTEASAERRKFMLAGQAELVKMAEAGDVSLG